MDIAWVFKNFYYFITLLLSCKTNTRLRKEQMQKFVFFIGKAYPFAINGSSMLIEIQRKAIRFQQVRGCHPLVSAQHCF